MALENFCSKGREQKDMKNQIMTTYVHLFNLIVFVWNKQSLNKNVFMIVLIDAIKSGLPKMGQ